MRRIKCLFVILVSIFFFSYCAEGIVETEDGLETVPTNQILVQEIEDYPEDDFESDELREEETIDEQVEMANPSEDEQDSFEEPSMRVRPVSGSEDYSELEDTQEELEEAQVIDPDNPFYY